MAPISKAFGALATLLPALLFQDGGTETLVPAPRGIVLLAIRQGSITDRAGLQPGDVVHHWSRAVPGRPGLSGTLGSAFDWTALALDQVPRGSVELRGLRAGAERAWTLPGGAPAALDDVQVRPELPDDLLALFETGRDRAAAGEVDAALAAWQRAEGAARIRGEEGVARWLALVSARALSAADRGGDADPVYRQLAEALATDSGTARDAAQVLREWAGSLRSRQLWARAEVADRQALELDGRAVPESLAASWSLTGLGYTASLSAGATDPDHYFQRALALRERLAPGSADVAMSFWDRGRSAMSRGDLRQALTFYQRAVALLERDLPGSLCLAERLISLGKAEYFLGDFESAEKSWRKALAIAELQAPTDAATVAVLQGLGDLELDRGNWRRAADLLAQAVTRGEHLPLDRIARADILGDLALAERHLGRKAESAAHACRAQEVFEEQRRQAMANPEAHLRWGAAFSDFARDCARALLEIGRPEEAFGVLERGRARTFLNLMAEESRRPVDLAGDPAAEWRRLDGEYDRIQTELADLEGRRPAAASPEVLRREGRLREIRHRKRELLSASRPGAAIRYPAPLDLAAAMQRLDPGTTLLSYVAAREETLLFIVTSAERRPTLATAVLPVGRKELAEKVEAFRRALVEDRFQQEEIRRQGRALYDLLVRPAEAALASGERLLIAPDGPLHVLPFAALVRDGRFLVETRPLHFALSASAYAELKARRQPQGDPAARALVAFGDPLRREEPAGGTLREADATLREALRRGLAPLPASRKEVMGIARHFPHARVFAGSEATEERVKADAGKAALLHFAVHALLNERTPVNSALVLSPPGSAGATGNGLLQGWEIMESLRLDADLVTLSACDTALGANMGGEGLIGLTSAFQQAGARSVVAALWGISDSPSADLMQHFYAALKEGKCKDEALRQAQIRQLHSSDAPEPFYWAAFQLYGDWQ